VGLVARAAIAAGPTSATVVAWRYRGVLRATVIGKATFAFAVDAAAVRTAPQPIFREDVSFDDHPARSTRFGSDLVPHLPRPEVHFTGHAHAAGGRPVELMLVRLGLFAGNDVVLDKTLRVRKPGGFTKVPLTYEQAFGGIGVRENVFGRDAAAGPTVIDPIDETHPASYAPIGRAWSARRALLGTTQRKAIDGSPMALPDDFTFDYFQAAPPDQRIAALRGDEWLVLDGVHPEHPRLRTRLPGPRGLALVHGLSSWGVAEGQPLHLHPDTLRIDGDEQRLTLTFRGIFPVQSEEALAGMRVVVGIGLPDEVIAWPVDLADRAGPSEQERDPESNASLATTVTLGEKLEASGRTTLSGRMDGGLASTLAVDPMHAAVLREPLPFQAPPAGVGTLGRFGIADAPTQAPSDDPSSPDTSAPSTLPAVPQSSRLPFAHGDQVAGSASKPPLEPAPKPAPARSHPLASTLAAEERPKAPQRREIVADEAPAKRPSEPPPVMETAKPPPPPRGPAAATIKKDGNERYWKR
jgi:hypothetical protein